jgi:hypothetical protein
MPEKFSYLRDDFEDNSQAPAWAGAVTLGSATKAESSGQAIFTLPSSTAGSHLANYATPTTYNLTSSSFSITIGTMVSTSVAATAYFELVYDQTSYLIWTQTSGTLKAQTVVAGVITDRYSVAWNASTYKYLRIRESGGSVLFDSSSDGTSWTNRATVANPFSVVSMSVQFGAFCGNVASPGSFRLDDVNLIALTTNWHWTQVEWPLLYRFKTITISASAGTGQAYIATSNDGTTWAYFSGPIGAASGGYDQLTAQSTQAAAQAMAVNMPLDGRWDLPSMVECRFIRLHHRSITGSAYALHEYYPRRLLQSDDIEAESIRAINIGAGQVTADKIFVLSLVALSASMGALHMDGIIDIVAGGGIYQGTGTFASPTTGLKLFNSGGVGKLSGYNATIEQITLDTDGKLKAGAGATVLDANGANILLGATYDVVRAYRILKADTTFMGGLGGAYTTGTGHTVELRSSSITGEGADIMLRAQAPSADLAAIYMQIQSGLTNFPAITVSTDNTTHAVVIDALNTSGTIRLTSPTTITQGLNVGSATGAGTGEIRTSDAIMPPRSSGVELFAIDGTVSGGALSVVNNGTATPFGSTRNFSGLVIISETAINGTAAVLLVDGGSGVNLVSSTGGAWTVTAGTASKTNVYLVSGALTIENKLGSTASYNVMALRTRSI